MTFFLTRRNASHVFSKTSPKNTVHLIHLIYSGYLLGISPLLNGSNRWVLNIYIWVPHPKRYPLEPWSRGHGHCADGSAMHFFKVTEVVRSDVFGSRKGGYQGD